MKHRDSFVISQSVIASTKEYHGEVINSALPVILSGGGAVVELRGVPRNERSEFWGFQAAEQRPKVGIYAGSRLK